MSTYNVIVTDKTTGEIVASGRFATTEAADQWFTDQSNAHPDRGLIPRVWITNEVEVAQ